MSAPDLIQLVIRGSIKKSVLDEARQLHNMTAGNPEGVAAARALGDLSHNVYVPLADAPTVGSELLFLDTWNSIDGLQKFFSDPQVQAGGNMMFESRDPVVALPADVYTFTLRAPKDRPDRFVGLLRGKVKSRESAKAFFDGMQKGINKARLSSLISHEIFYVAGPQGPTNELIGIDVWHDGEAMAKFYDGAGPALYDLFDGTPAASRWKQPAGQWVEW